MKKITYIFSLILILTMTIGSAAYAAPELSTPETDIVKPQYAILDGIRYGMSFSGTQVTCYAYMVSEHATKYVISGTLMKKNSSGYYDYVYSWPAETFNGNSCNYNKTCSAAGDGEYCFTINVTLYNGSQTEPLVFTYYKTRGSGSN